MEKRKMKKRIIMSDFDKEYLSKLNTYQDSVSIDNRHFYFKRLVSTEGKKSVVWEVSDKYNRFYILKLATFEDYIDRSFDEEMIKAAKVNDYPMFARIEGAEIKQFQVSHYKQIKCVAFLEERIEGTTLDNLLNEQVTLPFILNYIEKFCDVLGTLKYLKLRHDDLHPGNVMIVKPKPGLLKESLEIKIIDLGSIKEYYSPLKKIKNGIDDTINFAIHIKFLINKLLFLDNGERRILTSKENIFINESIKILNTIVDQDKGRALTKPFLINQTFQNLNSKIFSPTKDSVLKLNDPFDYITAEQINNDELLIKLFAESCPWIKDIISPNPILLTGPRGCGKSMVFRRFCLKALLTTNDKLMDEIQIAGFYISCSADLSNRLSIISESQAIRFKEEIIHYFNLILLKEIISTLTLIVERNDSFSKFGIDDNVENEVFTFVSKHLGITQERKLSLQGVKPIIHLLELIKFEINSTYSHLVKRTKIKNYTTFSFFSDITRFLSSTITYFRDKKITMLIDDYSAHRIPEHVQKLLNMVIWDRQGSHIFKVSSEKYGMVRILYNNTSADLSREYTEIDVGRLYINLSEFGKATKKFSMDLLNFRLSLANYKGNAESLIGNSNYSEGSLGKQIASGNNTNEYYHGIDTISQICSGDISTLLEIYNTIFRESDIKIDTVTQITKAKQHSAISSASKNFLDLTKTFHPYGYEMYKIVLHFGGLCKKILVEGNQQFDSKQKKSIPNETTRIEIEETEIPEEFSELNQSVYKELIRRAIFIEMEPSRGRHTLGITNRLQLRRIYCPSFGLSLSKNTAVKWSQSEFKSFLNDPENKCETEFNARWKKEVKNNKQEKLGL